MNQELLDTLDALYRLEEERLHQSDYDFWITPNEIAMALPVEHKHHGDVIWARQHLERLWVARKVLQMPGSDATEHHLVDVELLGLDRHGVESGKLRVERNDCRGAVNSEFEQVALYPERSEVRYRSRVAEVGRLLSHNYQRFKMARATGVLRYERRPQRRPDRNLPVSELSAQWVSSIQSGQLRIETAEHTVDCQLRPTVQRHALQQATAVVLQALAEQPRPGIDRLAPFQAASVMATLAGIYSEDYRDQFDAHVITAGVGSGKSLAFQVGALIHSAYTLLTGQKGVRVLLVYPRVALAANQFQDLFALVRRVGELLKMELKHPVLDAGGQLPSQMGLGLEDPGKLFNAIRAAYGSGKHPITISNLDTLANRLNHPEASRGLTSNLDLVVFDEIHLLNGLYGSHAKMLLKRLTLLRAMWRLREAYPAADFSALIARHQEVGKPYVIGASATIAEPNRHTARLIGCEERRILRVDVETPQETGWVHHFFLRQKPEISTMTALVNATSCLVHNRRDGLFREYYQQKTENPAPRALSLDDLNNPIQDPPDTIMPRPPDYIHKTLGFCDSLDGVGRWADLVADNEGTKRSGTVDANPQGSYPYFIRFQEPLWRVVHHLSFARQPEKWLGQLRTHYGDVCRKCKLGVRCSAKRVPDGLNQAGRRKVDELWDFTPTNTESYLQRMGVAEEFVATNWFQPFREAAQSETISNLDGCPFFKTGLCWWWSMDHAGSNAPAPADRTTPLNGIKMAGKRPDYQHHFVNALRLKSFTSQTEFDVLKISTINEVYRDEAQRLFRDRNYQKDQIENSALVIGSPRLEVGVDLSRVMDGITYRAMRDPSSLQQKVGRVGREMHSDSVLLHLVTQNARDQYYFRNPRIALDPNYLQALPLHEDNRIVARHHFFMAIVDFISLQGSEPGTRKIEDFGDRLTIINDHLFNPSFSGWDRKVMAVYNYLFGTHPHRDENRQNVALYLRLLGAHDHDIADPDPPPGLTAANAPMIGNPGALDIFAHEFGPKLLLTPLNLQQGGTATLAQMCATRFEPPIKSAPGLPRHEEFLKTFDSPDAEEARNPYRDRSYLRNLLELPLFRRGIPALNIPGDYPFIWTPNLFESAGTEIVRIFEIWDGRRKEIGYESVSSAVALLAPGTVSYRYGNSPRKVPVGSLHAIGLPSEIARGVQEVRLSVGSPEFFEPAPTCPDIQQSDLPPDFSGSGPIKIYSPRQVPLISSSSEPLVTRGEGLMADGDSRPVPQAGQTPPPIRLMTPPRCYPLQWFRMDPKLPKPVIPRFQDRLSTYAVGAVPNFPLPKVFSLFSAIQYDSELGVTDFVWGL
ncbi:MAG TPA: DEAD/DEAH box helicase, partial [Verrucomicrobiae bacterium]|nr:DEAD/DEAH box helicase [Verrucomicrobiae bacterium]